MIMKPKVKALFFVVGGLALCFAPLFAFGQDGQSAQQPATSEENILALLKAMFFQVLNSPASLFVVLGISIISTLVEMVIRASEKVSNKWILPTVLSICVLGGGLTYWMFSRTTSVDKTFPHPHAVLFVNGLICGVAAYIIHIWLVKFLAAKQEPPKP